MKNDKRPPDFKDFLEVLRYIWNNSRAARAGLAALVMMWPASNIPMFSEGQGELMMYLLIGFIVMIFFTTPWSGGK